jgi:hypothetical protein
MTRASPERVSAVSQVPTPPTTGRLLAKRARPSVVDTDDETPIKKPRARGKGKGKSRVREIANSDGIEPEEVEIVDSEEEREIVIPDSEEEFVVEQPVRVKEEEVEDDLTFDPEGQALGEDDDGEYEEDEGVKEDEEGDESLARLHSLARPAETIARSRRPRASIKLPCSVNSFQAVHIGRAGPLPPKSNEVQLECISEFASRMKHVIRQRRQLAYSLSRFDKSSPFTPGMWLWWTSQTEEEIWLPVHDAVDRSRQLVLGGVFLGHYKFTDIPAPSNEELKLWCVYGDLINDAEMYIGSATSAQGGFSRTGGYEKAKRRSNDGIDVSLETRGSRHLRVGLQPDAVMELRLFAFFDPSKCPVSLPLAIEGMFIDYFQTFARDWVYKEEVTFMSPNCLQASIDASLKQDAPWTGLNGAHPFKQGVRGGGISGDGVTVKGQLLDAQDWTCEVCYKQYSNAKSFNPSYNFPLLECKNSYICENCVRQVRFHPGKWDLESLRKVRESDHQTNLSNALALSNYRMTTEDFDALLAAQDDTCPCCYEKGHTRRELVEKDMRSFGNFWRHVLPAWSPHLDHAYWICMNCAAYLNLHGPSKSPQQIIQEIRDRKSEVAIARASMPQGSEATVSNKSVSIKVAKDKQFKDLKQQKLDAILAQNGACPICQKQKWGATPTAEEMTGKVGQFFNDASQKLFFPGQDRMFGCNGCFHWAKRHAAKKLGEGMSTEDAADLVVQRRESNA